MFDECSGAKVVPRMMQIPGDFWGTRPSKHVHNRAEVVGTDGPNPIRINNLRQAGYLRTKGSWVRILLAAPEFRF